MKKNNIFIYIFVIIFIAFLLVIGYILFAKFNLHILARDINDHNIKFNEFDRNLKGNEVLSLINFTLDHNRKEEDKSDNKEEQSLVLIEIEISDENTIDMNKIVQTGTENFAMYLGDQNFKPIDKEYHSNGKISKMKFKLLSVDSINNIENKLSI